MQKADNFNLKQLTSIIKTLVMYVSKESYKVINIQNIVMTVHYEKYWCECICKV